MLLSSEVYEICSPTRRWSGFGACNDLRLRQPGYMRNSRCQSWSDQESLLPASEKLRDEFLLCLHHSDDPFLPCDLPRRIETEEIASHVELYRERFRSAGCQTKQEGKPCRSQPSMDRASPV